METLRIDRQYSTGLSRHNIEQAVIAAGKDLKHLQPADLGTLERAEPTGVWGGEILEHGRIIDSKRPIGRPRKATLGGDQ